MQQASKRFRNVKKRKKESQKTIHKYDTEMVPKWRADPGKPGKP